MNKKRVPANPGALFLNRSMRNIKMNFLIAFACIILGNCKEQEMADQPLQLLMMYAGTTEINLSGNVTSGAPINMPLVLTFSSPVAENSLNPAIALKNDDHVIDVDISFLNNHKTVIIAPGQPLLQNTQYSLLISDQLKGAGGGSFSGMQVDFVTTAGALTINYLKIGGKKITVAGNITNVPLDLSMVISFSAPVDRETLESSIKLSGPGGVDLLFAYSDGGQTVSISTASPLQHLSKYEFALSNLLTGAEGESFASFSRRLYTEVDKTPKFTVISDEELLTKVQRQTFKYFWDFAHPVSGLARERNTSGDVVTTGGSGFGVMAILVGVERGFITRAEGIARLTKIVNFLADADRFHGAWPHWLNGSTGKVVPFSAKDNGGDLVETAFMIQGLLAVRTYLDENIPEEKSLMDKITTLWEEVEWTWYTQGGQNVLYWHWSPGYQWEMNHRISGYNEALVVYVLAASSPTYPISKDVYASGWARNGGIANGKSFYGHTLPLGGDYGGPLFFAHYSFLGLDPRHLSDQYADYWTQNVNHTLINQAYCASNPKYYAGYSEDCWGLTASDNHEGYSAHSPTNDKGVITPTAALSSFPYAPEASMKALKFFYYTLGDRLWGKYGFYDAFNVTEGWWADSYLAIDQGPIIVMIENYRSGLLWELFMSDPEVQSGLNMLGFSY